MNTNNYLRNALFTLFLIIPFVLFILHPLFNYSDDAIGLYSGTAMATLSHHSWLWPKTVYGDIYLEKGPVLYWIYQSLWVLFHNKALIFSIAHFSFYLGIGFSGVYLAKTITRTKLNAVNTCYVLAFILFSVFMLTKLFAFKFDKLLTLFILLNWALCIDILNTNKSSRAILLIITMILGPLVKGPVFTLYTLPLMLCLPFVIEGNKKQYYARILPALLLGISIPLLYLFLIKANLYDKTYLIKGQTSQRMGLFQHFGKHFLYITRLFTTLIPWIFAPSVLFAVYNYVKNKQHKRTLHILLLATALPFLVIFCLISSVDIRYVLPIYIVILMLMGIATYQAGYQHIIKADKYFCLLAAILVTGALVFMLAYKPMRLQLFNFQGYPLFSFCYGLLAITMLLHIAFSKSSLRYYYFLAAMAITAIFTSFLYKATPFSYNPFAQFDQMTQTINDYTSTHPNTTIGIYNGGYSLLTMAEWTYYKTAPRYYFKSLTTQEALNTQLKKSSNLLLVSFKQRPPFKNIDCFYHQSTAFKHKIGHDKKHYPVNFYLCKPIRV